MQGLEQAQDWEPLLERSDWLECLPAGQGFVFPAMRLASLLLRVVQDLAEGKKLKQSTKIPKLMLGIKQCVFSLMQKQIIHIS